MNTPRFLSVHAIFAAVCLGLSAAPSFAQAGPISYDLDAASSYTQGCYPPCLCPILFNDNLVGTMRLQFTASDPAGYDHYAVTNVNWLLGLGSPDQITGSGEYVRGGAVAILEQLVLDLSANGAAPEHYDSGLVSPAATFPAIDISISLNGMVCFDKVYHVVAMPGITGTPYCSGDGSGTACPCGNAGASGNGCASSVNPNGSSLFATGSASLSNDTVVLHSSGTPDASVLFFQGTQQTSGGAGAIFGDGLRCASGTIRRLRAVLPSSGNAHIPGPMDPPVSVLGAIGGQGVFEYQVWYRNAAAFCTPSTFNLSNGFQIHWAP